MAKKETIYIKPSEHYEAVVAGEPQSLVSISVWASDKNKAIALSFETTQGEDPNDHSAFTVCVRDAQRLIDAIKKTIAG